MVTTTQELKQAMKAKGFTAETLAPIIGLSGRTWSLRHRGKVAWELDKVYQAMNILGLPIVDIQKYFSGGNK